MLAIVISLLLLCLSSGASSAFSLNEYPTTGLTQDTAYTLKAKEATFFAAGWATYGITDRWSVGTNVWGDMLLFSMCAGSNATVNAPNVYTKYKIVDEKGFIPTIAVGASLCNVSTRRIHVIGYDFGLYLSGRIGSTYGYLTYKHMTLSVSNINVKLGTLATFGTITNLDRTNRLLIEIGQATLVPYYQNQYGGGLALEHDFGYCRGRLGCYLNLMNGSGIPWLDLYWKYAF